MTPKLPSSIMVSLYLALVLTGTYGILTAFTQAESGFNLYAALAFFFITFFVLVITLEWIVYRKLKSLTLLNEREIKKLKDMETFRREFLGEVSHELKTPIFAVQGFIHTLMDGAIEDEKVRMRFLKKAMKNADRLSNLVQDLLIVTQAESGEMDLRIRQFNFYELIQEVQESLEYKLTKKNRDISCIINPNGEESTKVLADRERIHQVLVNLVDNAIKYGNPEGTITLNLERLEDKLKVSVVDDGPGIGEEHLQNIFRRFYRVDKSRSREKGGTGLGLAICKHLLKMHGEAITVESELEKGTTFFFTLKLAQ